NQSTGRSYGAMANEVMSNQVMLWQAVSDYGFGWLAARFVYEMRVRSGFQTLRFAQRSWSENELSRWLSPGVPYDPAGYAGYWRERRRPFFFLPGARADYARPLGKVLGETGLESLTSEARRIEQGTFSYFFSQPGNLGFPPDWHRNPFTGQRTSPTAHWSRIPMFSHASGDLKFIWEPGRFASAYKLARAYWVAGDESYAETFWRLVESWERANPPNHGAHWKCGQETSLRIMAWCFALYAFADSTATTPERLTRLVGMIAAQADRVAGDHVYARLQRNNHSISEGAGLWTVGSLFPELKHAQAWRAAGRGILADEAERQIASDGSYIQNSTNYHRLMLQDYLWAIRLGEVTGDPLPDSTSRRIERAVEFLYQIADGESGHAPCYGHNDGALILPLNTCDYSDFRPVIAAGHYLAHRRRLYEAGPWEEDLLWLFGPDALEAPAERIERGSLAAREGGYYTLRGERAFALTRCVTYRYRPSQADMLHMDLWWRGANVACDPGSYLYYADPPWDNGLNGTVAHNTVTVDGEDQMTRGPRFMWFDWTEAEALAHDRSAQGNLERFEGRHNGYERLSAPVTHRRAILRAGDDVWLVADDLLGEGSHEVMCQWLLAAGEHVFDEQLGRLRLSLPVGDAHVYWNAAKLGDARVDLSCGDESEAPRGWRSRYYGAREPALSFRVAGRGDMPCRIVSVFVLGDPAARVSFDDERVTVSGGDGTELSVFLSPLALPGRLSINGAKLTRGERVEMLGAI
ncbi:MAG TPA: alginate lyase family protein, partial [Blastocatellia bacterium]|nr:alginate lyase family protein [Blastocatellia bacterium]